MFDHADFFSSFMVLLLRLFLCSFFGQLLTLAGRVPLVYINTFLLKLLAIGVKEFLLR